MFFPLEGVNDQNSLGPTSVTSWLQEVLLPGYRKCCFLPMLLPSYAAATSDTPPPLWSCFARVRCDFSSFLPVPRAKTPLLPLGPQSPAWGSVSNWGLGKYGLSWCASVYPSCSTGLSSSKDLGSVSSPDPKEPHLSQPEPHSGETQPTFQRSEPQEGPARVNDPRPHN